MDIQEFHDQLQEHKERLKEAEELVQEYILKNAKKFLLARSKELFAKYPEMKNFGWQQGQYYDDNSYSFEVRSENDFIFINDKEFEVPFCDMDDGDQADWMSEATVDISNMLNELETSDFEILFGNASVTVTPKTIVFEYFDGDC